MMPMLPQGGPPMGPEEGGMPPELLAMLSGGMQEGMPPPSMGPQGPPPPPEEEEDVDPLEHLRLAIEHAQAALVAEPDDADSQQLSKVISGLYQILAQRQKEQDQLMGGGNLRALRRTAG